MKTKIFALALLALTLTGCLTHTPVVSTSLQPVVSQQPTPFVSQVVNPTNGIVTTVTNVVLVPVTNFVPVTVTNTVYAANTNQIQSVASTIGTINAATAPFDPYAPAVSTALPWFTTIALALSTGIAGFLNSKKNGIISAITTGIEGAAGDLPDNAPITLAQVKASVQKQATLQGNLPAVHAAVQANT